MSQPSPLRSWTVWGVGLAVYMLAIFHRSSLAVAGLHAQERFGISASQLATFTMLQLLVYAAMQVPVGVLVDRFGSRRVLCSGLILMSISQAAFAFAQSYGTALAARVFVGIGDALTFICVLRLVSSWFPPRRIPLVSQLTGSIGQLGAIASAVPMTWALGQLGWTWAYLTAALLGVLVLALLLAVVHDSPQARVRRGAGLTPRELFAGLRASWGQPGTRLGFWVHFSTPFSAHAFSLLWGFPFLVTSEGLTEAAAGALLSVLVVVSIASGPVLGWLVGTKPWHRSTIALTAVAAMACAWTAVLSWPGEAPIWLLLVLVATIGVGGPSSMIGFDIGRTSNPAERYATASGLINQGGFIAALTAVVTMGLLLDAHTPGESTDYTPEAYTWAMSVQYLLWGLGASQIWRLRRHARRLVPRASVEQGDTSVG